VTCSAYINEISGKVDFREETDIDEYPYSLKPGIITYRLDNLSPDIKESKDQLRAVTVAFRVWQLRIKDLKFKREYDPNKEVDIRISFEPLETFSSPGVLAHATLPHPHVDLYCEINDEWNWVSHSKIADIGHPPLVPILIHEFGHILGLRHDTHDKASIMYPSFNLGQKKNQLGPRDIERIQERYGKRNISQRFIDYFRRRRDMGWDF